MKKKPKIIEIRLKKKCQKEYITSKKQKKNLKRSTGLSMLKS